MKGKSKIDLKEVTFCIPVRIESSYRIQNLKTLLNYLDSFLDTNYIVMEADRTSRFTDARKIRNLKHVFIQDEDVIFHRTKYINRMLHLTETPYAAIWDTDAIAPIEQIEKALTTLRNTETTLVYPFSGAFIALNEIVSMHFCKTLDINCLNSDVLPKAFLYGFYSVGGAYMVNVQNYLKAGGENEHFYGWGPEDAERNARIRILEMGVDKIEGPLYHLFHTRGINSRDSNQENAMNNKREFCKICGMTTAELQDYIKTWSWNKNQIINEDHGNK